MFFFPLSHRWLKKGVASKVWDYFTKEASGTVTCNTCEMSGGQQPFTKLTLLSLAASCSIYFIFVYVPLPKQVKRKNVKSLE